MPLVKVLPTANYKELPKLKQFTKGSVGIDLYCASDATIMPRQKIDIPCAIKLELPKGYYARITGRSSSFMLGIDIREGIIDQDYRGEIYIGAYNFSDETVTISRGDRLAQMLISKYEDISIEYVESINDTQRGDGGFGSTDVTVGVEHANFINKEFLDEFYIKKGLSAAEIAKRFNVGKTTVLRKMTENGVAALNSWERHPPELDELQSMLIAGSIIGDLSIKHSEAWTHARCDFAHGPNQIDYLRYKKDIMAKFVTMDINSKYNKEFDSVTFYFSTITHPIFTRLREEYYPNGVKVVTDKLLNRLNPFSLSVWYMDDGSLHISNSNSRWISMHVEGFDPDSQVRILSWLNDNRYEAKFRNDGKGHRFIVLNSIGTRRLIDTVEPHIIPCMQYKIR